MTNAEIYKKAVNVLGSEVGAEYWLSQPARGLDYRIPCEVMQFPMGRHEVYSLLQLMEYCVYI